MAISFDISSIALEPPVHASGITQSPSERSKLQRGHCTTALIVRRRVCAGPATLGLPQSRRWRAASAGSCSVFHVYSTVTCRPQNSSATLCMICTFHGTGKCLPCWQTNLWYAAVCSLLWYSISNNFRVKRLTVVHKRSLDRKSVV